MILTYSGKSKVGAQAIADESDDIELSRSGRGDVNWGRNRANTQLNPDISNCTNKRVMRELFAKHGVPMPKLIEPTLAFGPWSDNKPVVGRPDQHTKGRGFWLCRNAMQVSRAMMGTRRKKAATHFMEYVEADYEYRVHIFKGKSIRISQKVFFQDPDTGVVDKSTYYTGKPKGDIKAVRKAAKQAVAALGLDFGAVDILARDEYEIQYGSNQLVTRAYVLEVNAAPGLGGSMPALYAKVFQEWYDGDWDD